MVHNLEDLHIRETDPPLVTTWAVLYFPWKQTSEDAFGKSKSLDVIDCKILENYELPY